MKAFIEKLISRLEERSKEYNSGVRLHGKPEEMLTYEAIEIVNQLAEEYKPTIDVAELVEKFGQENEQNNNGWIPVSSGKLPEKLQEETPDDCCPEYIVMIEGADKATVLKYAPDGTWFDEYGVTYKIVAWQSLPEPYQPKGE